MPHLALKIDVSTWRGTLQGVPRLVEALHRHEAQASFFFSLGPDQTGRTVGRALHPGIMQQAARTSAFSHYGVKTLLYGTLLPAPDIGRRGADILRGVQEAGFETGIRAWNRVRWQDQIANADGLWTEQEMRHACQSYQDIFGTAARTHAAASWQLNAHALRLTQRLGFDYSCDTRGRHPYMPVWQGEVIHCPQLPTTLPTLDELVGVGALDIDNVHERLLELTLNPPAQGHVFSLQAEREGLKWLPIFEKLLQGWRDQGYTLTTTRTIFASLDLATLPRHEVIRGELPGRTGTLMLQGNEFLNSWRLAAA
jgi:undecaprenyl phosphate-alpha-L-ara4FN deformylase